MIFIWTGDPPAIFSVKNRLKSKIRGHTLAVSGGQPAETDFATLARGPGMALIEARPRTGRTPQIRAHLAGEGFPLLGDILYGGPGFIALGGHERAVTRHLLHAARLAFDRPLTAARIVVDAPRPQDFEVFLSSLELPGEKRLSIQ